MVQRVLCAEAGATPLGVRPSTLNTGMRVWASKTSKTTTFLIVQETALLLFLGVV